MIKTFNHQKKAKKEEKKKRNTGKVEQIENTK